MDKPEEKKGKTLTPDEERELNDGDALYEMTQNNPGWKIVANLLQEMAFHTWIDPRSIDKPGGLSKEEWEWRELNAFHAANNAKELLESIQKMISRAEYLGKIRSGEITNRSMRI